MCRATVHNLIKFNWIIELLNANELSLISEWIKQNIYGSTESTEHKLYKYLCIYSTTVDSRHAFKVIFQAMYEIRIERIKWDHHQQNDSPTCFTEIS